MKLRYIFSSAFAVMLAGSVVSCIDDNSTYGGDVVPELSVVLPDGDDDMPVYNVNYGEEFVFTPEIRYNGSSDNLRYEWSVGTYDSKIKGPLEVVGNEKTLRHSFPKGGAYYAHLVVSDGTVGLAQDFEISVNRTFEQGYVLISNDKDGNGNLTFIKDPTREEIEQGIPVTIMENSLQRVNDNLASDKLIGSSIISWYVSATQAVFRLFVGTEKQGLFIDPNTFVTISTIDYDEVIPGFRATNQLIDYTNPMMYDSSSKRYLTLNSNLMFGYEDSSKANDKFDYMRMYSYMSYGDNSQDVFYVDLNPLKVYKYSYYGMWTNSSELADESGQPLNLFADDELLAIFYDDVITYTYEHPYYGEMSATVNPTCVISRNKNTGDVYTTIFTGMAGGYSMGIEYRGHSKSPTDANSALPVYDCPPVLSEIYHRSYFYRGNKVYTMLREEWTYTFPSENQASIQLPDNEEITYMGMDQRASGSDVGSETLIIATVNKTTGRGSVYFYDPKEVRTDNPNPAPKAYYPDCAGRISYIMYKPRIV